MYRVIQSIEYSTLQLAGREGFEPSIQFYPYTFLAGKRFRPLSHLPRWLNFDSLDFKKSSLNIFPCKEIFANGFFASIGKLNSYKSSCRFYNISISKFCVRNQISNKKGFIRSISLWLGSILR